MENLKINIGSEAESKEAQELYFKLGYKWGDRRKVVQHTFESIGCYLVAWSNGRFKGVIQVGCGSEDAEEITIEQLRDMVVLKRNDVGDTTHSHYKKDVSNLKIIDVYRTLELFEVKSHAVGHAIKKLLLAGERGAKDYEQDIQEAIDSLNRELQMQQENKRTVE